MSSPLSSWGLLALSFSPLLPVTRNRFSSMFDDDDDDDDDGDDDGTVQTRCCSAGGRTRGRGMRGRCTRDAARPACETFNLLLNPFTAEIFSSTVTVTFRNSHASHGREKFENIAAFYSGC